MGLAPGDAVFVAERRTWIDGRAITRARLLHPGVTHRLVARTRAPI
jgi:DNA-binding GntR family transcriptional regulator